MTNEAFEDLVSLYLDKEITSEQMQVLQQALVDNPERKQLFAEHCRLHQAAQIAARRSSPRTFNKRHKGTWDIASKEENNTVEVSPAAKVVATVKKDSDNTSRRKKRNARRNALLLRGGIAAGLSISIALVINQRDNVDATLAGKDEQVAINSQLGEQIALVGIHQPSGEEEVYSFRKILLQEMEAGKISHQAPPPLSNSKESPAIRIQDWSPPSMKPVYSPIQRAQETGAPDARTNGWIQPVSYEFTR